MNRRRVRALTLFFLAAVALVPSRAGAHEFGALQVELLAPRGSTLELVLTVDPEHLPPGLVPEGTAPEARAEVALERLAAGLELGVEARRLTLTPAPDAGSPGRTGGSEAALTQRRFHVELPDGPAAVTIRQTLDVGPYVIRAAAIEGADAPIHWALGGGTTPVEIRFGLSAAPPSRLEVCRDYLILGFTHILPKGLDHILFVLGLFLLSTRWKPLLVQVSAFTLAHTLTLAAAIYGVVRLAPTIVEPLIALSIAYVAIENLLTTELRPWRTALVFAFGLLHGLGFAGVLAELGLPRGRFLAALLSFNLGVELGQLAVIAAAFLLVGWARRRPRYRRAVVVPASLAIAAAGLWWFVERAVLQR